VLNQVSVPSDQHSAMLFALFAPVVPKFFQFAKSAFPIPLFLPTTFFHIPEV
jgi:hypothetical protein